MPEPVTSEIRDRVEREWRRELLTVYVAVPGLSLAGFLLWHGPATARIAGSLVLLALFVLGVATRNQGPAHPAQKPFVLWIRRFEASTQFAYRTQMFLEGVVPSACDGYVITLADTHVQLDTETRLLRHGWTHAGALFLGLIWVARLTAGTDRLVGASLLLLGYPLLHLWKWWVATPLAINEASAVKLKETLAAMRAGRIAQRSLRLRCPVQGRLWEEVVNALLPFTDAVIISERDLGHGSQEGPVAQRGLEWEVDRVRQVLGPGKMVVLSGPANPALSSERLAGARCLAVPNVIPWWPFSALARNFTVELRLAVRTRATTPQLASVSEMPMSRWNGDEYHRRLWLRRILVIVVGGLTPVAAMLLALVGSAFVGGLARRFHAPIPADQRILPALVADAWLRYSFVCISLASGVSMLFCYWRPRPLSRTILGGHLVNLALLLIFSGCNFYDEPIHRLALAILNFVFVGTGHVAASGLRKIWPRSVPGAALRASILFVLLFQAVFAPLLFAAVLVLNNRQIMMTSLPRSGLWPNWLTDVAAVLAAIFAARDFVTERTRLRPFTGSDVARSASAPE
jgi:hypothetical protein